METTTSVFAKDKIPSNELERLPSELVDYEENAMYNGNFGMSVVMSGIDDNDFVKIRPMEWNACIYLNEVDPATPATTKP